MSNRTQRQYAAVNVVVHSFSLCRHSVYVCMCVCVCLCVSACVCSPLNLCVIPRPALSLMFMGTPKTCSEEGTFLRVSQAEVSKKHHRQTICQKEREPCRETAIIHHILNSPASGERQTWAGSTWMQV